MSEWTDADVEATTEALVDARWSRRSADVVARALLASGVVVPARVVEEIGGPCARHADWKTMYESAIEAANNASKTADHLRGLLDELAPTWRSVDAPGRRRNTRAERAEADLSRLRSAVEALADEWEAKHAAHINAATHATGELMAACQVASGSVRKLCADEARALLTEGRDRAGEGAAFREGECAPRRCSCIGHVVPGVEHSVPCCDEQHVTAGEGAGS